MERRYVANRIAQTILTLFVVMTLMWLLFRLVPGDPTAMYVSGRLTPEDIESIRQAWGLNESLYMQYFRYMANLLQGDLGTSFYYREKVIDIIAPKVFNTLILMGPAMIMAIITGTLIGSRTFLTAAHCFDDSRNPDRYRKAFEQLDRLAPRLAKGQLNRAPGRNSFPARALFSGFRQRRFRADAVCPLARLVSLRRDAQCGGPRTNLVGTISGCHASSATAPRGHHNIQYRRCVDDRPD